MKNLLLFIFTILLVQSVYAQQYGVYHHFDISGEKKDKYVADLTILDTSIAGTLQRGNSMMPLRVKGSIHSQKLQLNFSQHDSVLFSFSGNANAALAKITGTTSTGEKWQFTFDSTKAHNVMAVVQDTFRYVWRKNKSGKPLGCTTVYQYCFFPKTSDSVVKAVNDNLLDETLTGKENVADLRNLAINAMDDDFSSFQDSYSQVYHDTTSYDQMRYMDEAPQVYIWESQKTRQVIYNKNDLMSIEFFNYSYQGGAHGNYEYAYNNFNLKTGASFTWDDVLKPGYQDQLSILLAQALRKKFNIKPDQTLASAGLLVNEVPQPATFFLSDYGLGIVYNPYDVAPYVYGAITLFLPWSDLKNLINPSGPLAQLMK